MKRVEIYTDGACKGNPGPGGWGVVLRWNGKVRELCGAEADTTNNRMELQAAIRGLGALKERCHVRLTTDSEYLKNGISRWLNNWKRNNWRTAGKKPVKNMDLWQELERASAAHDVEWHWVRGHSGHAGNERADALANEAIARFMSERGGA